MRPAVESVQDLKPAEYRLFAQLIYEKTGINLGDSKQQLVRARLGKRLRDGQFGSYREYYDFVLNEPSGRELCELIDAISTNTTHLFREIHHFEFLIQTVKGWLRDSEWRKRHDTLRVWSAACSSGEEPHSLAITLHDALANTGVTARILATDISTRVLAKARQGVYDEHRLGTVPAQYRRRYFQRHRGGEGQQMVIHPDAAALITFARLNLMSDTFPFKHPFDFIFCRNVMIYFDKPTQAALVTRCARHLAVGGFFVIGHSESLNSLQQPLKYVRPTIYQRQQ